MKRIGEIIKDLKIGMGGEKRDFLRNDDIESLWFRIIGEELKGHCYVSKVYHDTMIVKVDSSVYLSEINFRKDKLLAVMKKETGGRIRKIIFKI